MVRPRHSLEHQWQEDQGILLFISSSTFIILLLNTFFIILEMDYQIKLCSVGHLESLSTMKRGQYISQNFTVHGITVIKKCIKSASWHWSNGRSQITNSFLFQLEDRFKHWQHFTRIQQLSLESYHMMSSIFSFNGYLHLHSNNNWTRSDNSIE